MLTACYNAIQSIALPINQSCNLVNDYDSMSNTHVLYASIGHCLCRSWTPYWHHSSWLSRLLLVECSNNKLLLPLDPLSVCVVGVAAAVRAQAVVYKPCCPIRNHESRLVSRCRTVTKRSSELNGAPLSGTPLRLTAFSRGPGPKLKVGLRGSQPKEGGLDAGPGPVIFELSSGILKWK